MSRKHKNDKELYVMPQEHFVFKADPEEVKKSIKEINEELDKAFEDESMTVDELSMKLSNYVFTGEWK